MAVYAAVIGGAVTVVTSLFLAVAQPWAQKVVPPPTSAPPKPRGEPLQVNRILPVPREDDSSWVLPGTIGAAKATALNERLEAAGGIDTREGDRLMRETGAVETRWSTIEIEMAGNRAGLVRVTDIRAVPRCRKPLSGTFFDGSYQGGEKNVNLGFDLEEPKPFARKVLLVNDVPRFRGRFFPEEKIDLGRNQQKTFRLTARAVAGYCEFRYEFDLMVDGKPVLQLVPDPRLPPLRVSGLHERARPGDTPGLVNCGLYQASYVRGSLIPAVDVNDPRLKTPWVASRTDGMCSSP